MGGIAPHENPRASAGLDVLSFSSLVGCHTLPRGANSFLGRASPNKSGFSLMSIVVKSGLFRDISALSAVPDSRNQRRRYPVIACDVLNLFVRFPACSNFAHLGVCELLRKPRVITRLVLWLAGWESRSLAAWRLWEADHAKRGEGFDEGRAHSFRLHAIAIAPVRVFRLVVGSISPAAFSSENRAEQVW